METTGYKAVLFYDGKTLEVNVGKRVRTFRVDVPIERVGDEDSVVGRCQSCGLFHELYKVEDGVWTCLDCSRRFREIKAISDRA